MTYDNFIQLIKHPESLSESDQFALKELIAKYPYFGIAKWLYLKSLSNSESIYFDKELKKTALYAANRRNLYFFIHPEELSENDAALREKSNSTGSYFDMINLLESKQENNPGALQSLAERLKSAREMLHVNSQGEEKTESIHANQSEKIHTEREKEEPDDFKEMEAEAKKMIQEKKYEEAIHILEKLYLNNPKKSIYFADQIRFLKKITKT